MNGGAPASFLEAAEQSAIRDTRSSARIATNAGDSPLSGTGSGTGAAGPNSTASRTRSDSQRSESPSPRGPRRPSGPLPQHAAKASVELKRARSVGQMVLSPSPTVAQPRQPPPPHDTPSGSSFSPDSTGGAAGGLYSSAIAAATDNSSPAPQPPTAPPAPPAAGDNGSPSSSSQTRQEPGRASVRERRSAQIVRGGSSGYRSDAPKSPTAQAEVTVKAKKAKTLSTLPHLSRKFESSFVPSPSAQRGVDWSRSSPESATSPSSDKASLPTNQKWHGNKPRAPFALMRAADAANGAAESVPQSVEDPDKPPSLQQYIA